MKHCITVSKTVSRLFHRCFSQPIYHTQITIVISGEHGFAKPDTRLFIQALREMDTKPENTVMVGDKLKTDIKGAKETGICTIWINREGKIYEDQSVQPDFEIDNLLQINNFIH